MTGLSRRISGFRGGDRWSWERLLALALPAMAAWLGQTAPALAHPHVWVTVESTVVFGPNRQITGIRHKWTFDELYSSFAVQGLDKKGGSNPTREDLKELADTNVESLKEFGYFTFPQATRTEPTKAVAGAAPPAPEKAPIGTPVDYYLEHKDGLLSLYFTLPLEKAVGVDGQAFGFAVYDPSYFIAFQYAKEKPVQLSPGAPADCVAALQQPGAEAAQVGNKADRLADAFSKALGPGSGIAVGADQAVVSCKGKP